MTIDVLPDKQNLEQVFTKEYDIDFYQRDYKWGDEPVNRLLDDILFKFEESYEKYKDFEVGEENIDKNYSWYYLNTYVTNRERGKTFIVDGQQRLTTLSLILIKLYHLTKSGDENLHRWVGSRIAGQTGRGKNFWIKHEGYSDVQNCLFENRIDDADSKLGITAENMIKNFKIISSRLDSYLIPSNESVPNNKLETFIYYFLRRLVLIELNVAQTDVPMVFEVINDRGVRLKPFEILKGKLLGQLDKDLLEDGGYNKNWDNQISAINGLVDGEADRFFRFYLRAKFADTRSEGQVYDGDYHRVMFSNSFQDKIALLRNKNGVKDFLDGHFKYYSSLYRKALELSEGENNTNFLYNKLLSIDGAFHLILAACKENDTEEEEKLNLIPAELDRAYTLLQLQDVYDSNKFQEMIFKIASDIRGGELSAIRSVFDEHILERISVKNNKKADNIFVYSRFRDTGTKLNRTFLRYFFARIEEFLVNNMNKQMTYSLSELASRKGTSFHIEHILANNDENLKVFKGDEEVFDKERNRLGAVLLLKGRDNQSSGDEVYEKKLKTYAGSLCWNQTLCNDFHHANIALRDLINEFGFKIESIDKFDADAVENRQKLLFDIASVIWK